MEEDKSILLPPDVAHDNGHGWQKVTYSKKQRKIQTDSSKSALPNGSGFVIENGTVFKGLEKHAQERRRKLEAQRIASSAYEVDDEFPLRSRKIHGDDDDDDYASSDPKETEVNKKEKKPNKIKKPKITVAEAAAKIDANDLAAFLSSVSVSYDENQDIQLMRFADYFGRAFSAVGSAQFPWLKLFRESLLEKFSDVPVTYISEPVYMTSVDWINHFSLEALGTFVLWLIDCILADLATQQLVSKGSKKGWHPTSSKSQVAIFLVLAMVLRRKPDALIIHSLPKLRDTKYQGLDKLPVFAWMTAQASQGDLAVGLYLWAHYILPTLGGKSGSNPQSRDLVLQLVERILAAPKALPVLVNGAVRKSERLISPAALELLLRITFPASSARVKATERFEAIYPILKEVALAGSPGSKAMKQVSQQLQFIALKLAGEGIPALFQEATSIFLWCLIQNPDCCKQWDKIYVDNIEVSVSTLRKLSDEWVKLSLQQSSLQVLGETLRSFRQKNEKALSGVVDGHRRHYFSEADKYCKALLRKLSSGNGCLKTLVFTTVVVAVGAAIASTALDAWYWDKLSVLFSTHPSF